MNATSAFHALKKTQAKNSLAPRWAKGVAPLEKEVGGDVTSELEESVALGKQEQSSGETGGGDHAEEGKQSGSCFSVVSSAVRKGKGRGKGTANSAGGYVPVHLRSAEEIEADEAKKESEAAAAPVVALPALATPAPPTSTPNALSTSEAVDQSGTAASSPAAVAPPAEQQPRPDLSSSEGQKRSRWQRRARVDAAAAAAAVAASAAPSESVAAGAAEATVVGTLPPSFQSQEGDTTEPPWKRQRVEGEASEVLGSVIGDEGSPAKPSEPVGMTLAKLSVSQLKTLARYHAVSFVGCVEKGDMLAALRAKGLDDTAAQRFDEATSKNSSVTTPAAPVSAEEAYALAEAQKAEARAKAAEEEAKQLQAMLAKKLTSSRKKCAPTLSSIERDLAGKPKDFDPLFPNGDDAKGGGASNSGNSGGCFKVPTRPTGGVDLRQQPGLASVAGGPGWDICWDHKRGFCAKGSACKWKHG